MYQTHAHFATCRKRNKFCKANMKVLMKNYLIQFQMSIGDGMMVGRMDPNNEKKYYVSANKTMYGSWEVVFRQRSR